MLWFSVVFFRHFYSNITILKIQQAVSYLSEMVQTSISVFFIPIFQKNIHAKYSSNQIITKHKLIKEEGIMFETRTLFFCLLSQTSY